MDFKTSSQQSQGSEGFFRRFLQATKDTGIIGAVASTFSGENQNSQPRSSTAQFHPLKKSSRSCSNSSTKRIFMNKAYKKLGQDDTEVNTDTEDTDLEDTDVEDFNIFEPRVKIEAEKAGEESRVKNKTMQPYHDDDPDKQQETSSGRL